ncbi:Uncharacterised protein [Burkholderia pseudomallei]|nr:Uncharacterised protein [Burkholderia pseudomallei]CAJ8167596.1 Uncharacterised protein [Burkholderia pseudomallei]
MATNAQVNAHELKPARKSTNGEKQRSEVEQTRDRARLQFPVETVAHLTQADAFAVQRVLQHGDSYGVWETPLDWLAPGAAKANVNLRERILHFLPQEVKNEQDSLFNTALEAAVLTLVRYCCLLRMGPSGKGRNSFRSLSPSSVREIAYSYGPPLMALAVAKQISKLRHPCDEAQSSVSEGTHGLLSGLTPDDFDALTSSARKHVLQECNRMEMLHQLGLWWDTPVLNDRSLAEAMTGSARHNDAPSKRKPHLPLPDEYVAELGSRGLWLMYDLAPNLFRIGAKLVEIWEETDKPHLASTTVRDARGNATRELLSTFEWRDREGKLIEKPPFPLNLPKVHGFGDADEDVADEGEQRWPPHNYRDFKGLLGAVQSAHLCAGMLSMGPRRSEILSLERACVVYAVDGRAYADGRTFKLVERHEGDTRDWQLPEVAVYAFEQQVRLMALAESVDSLNPKRSRQRGAKTAKAHMWGRVSAAYMSNAMLPLGDINPTLISYARMLNMDTEPGGQTLRSHRFRKTLARLVALALTQAPRLLMQIFGHKSIEMTLYYILADKELRAEIETVSRELRIMRAKAVVETMLEAEVTGDEEHGGYGGPAAATIHHAIEVKREQMHRYGKEWELSSATELAELLTLQGKAWEVVRPGVICTKFSGEAGPCNKSKGRPEPSKCQSRCAHRLEEAFLREDLDGAIRDSVLAYEQAIADDESLTAAHWAAQVRSHVPRFSDLMKKWMTHPTVSALMANKDTKVPA